MTDDRNEAVSRYFFTRGKKLKVSEMGVVSVICHPGGGKELTERGFVQNRKYKARIWRGLALSGGENSDAMTQ